MRVRPITLRAASRYIAEHHRHSDPTRGWLFGCQVVDADGTCHGVGVAGRPIGRHSQDGATIEILRNCTDGTPNAASMIYGALCRAARALGYERAMTFTLASEPGTSLRAAGFERDGDVPAQPWTRPSRPRYEQTLFGDRRPAEDRVRWLRRLA